MISWRLCFIFVDIMKMMYKSFKFFVKAQVKAQWLLFIVSTTFKVLIFDQIIVSFCFFCSSLHQSIAWVSCSLISRENLSFASLFSDFIMWCSFSNMMFCKIEISLLWFCYDHVAVVMLEYQIIIFKKSLK